MTSAFDGPEFYLKKYLRKTKPSPPNRCGQPGKKARQRKEFPLQETLTLLHTLVLGLTTVFREGLGGKRRVTQVLKTVLAARYSKTGTLYFEEAAL